MIHPHTVLRFISKEIGNGVFATQDIPVGTITWAQDQLDRELTPEEVDNLASVCKPVLETYTYRNHRGNYLLCWDIARYMNHSFKPNCMATPYGFEVAVQNIAAGEQLTNDYGWLNIVAPFRPSDEGTRRKTVYPDDLLRHYQRWDQTLSKVLVKVVKQEQVLRELIAEETWQKLHEIATGASKPESLIKNFFRQK